MRAGKLRHYGRVERDTPTRDTDGAEIPSWSLVAEVFMEVAPKVGAEFWSSLGRVDRQVVPIRIRYDERFLGMERERWRIVHNGKVYDITSVVNVDLRNRVMELATAVGSAVPRDG